MVLSERITKQPAEDTAFIKRLYATAFLKGRNTTRRFFLTALDKRTESELGLRFHEPIPPGSWHDMVEISESAMLLDLDCGIHHARHGGAE